MKKFHALLLAMLFVTAFAGCASYRPLQIEPVAKNAAIIIPKFTTSYFYFDRDHNLYFIMRTQTTDKDTHKPVEQIFTARIFWRPSGGKTSLNQNSLNATYRYVLITPDTVAMYEGAGFIRLMSVEAAENWHLFGKYSGAHFVRLWNKNGHSTVQARLMDGDLHLTQASAAFVDNLGRAHIRGNFSATCDDAHAFDLLLQAHREFFDRSLLSKPAPAATQPGEPREDTAPWPLEPPPGPVIAPPATAPAPATRP